jgi:hypothetical protein
MSYDISLYVQAFLDRALASGLGDWRDADPIPESAVEALIQAAVAEGFTSSGAGKSFLLDTPEYLAQLSIHRGELAFAIPYSNRADASVQVCARIAKSVAATHGLAFWDPQNDESE